MPEVSRCRLLTRLNERQSSGVPRPAHFPGRNSRSGAAVRASRRHHRRLPHDENRAGRLIGRTATSARWPTLSGLPPFLLRPRTNSHLRLAEKSVTQLFEQSFDFSGSRASQTASPTNAIAVTIIFFNVLSVTTSNSGAIRDRNMPPTDGNGRWKTACQSSCSHRPAERSAARIAECRFHSPSRSASTRLSDYRRWPRLIPSFIAFWRTEPIVLFIALATLATGVFAFECARNSFTCSLVYRTRVRFFAFLATKTLLSVRALSIIQLVLGNPFQKYQSSAGSLSPSGLG